MRVDSVRGGLPAGHERRRLPAQQPAQRLRPDGPARAASPGRPLAARRRPAADARSLAVRAPRALRQLDRPQRARQQRAAAFGAGVAAARLPVGGLGRATCCAQRTTEHPLQPFSRRYFEAPSAQSRPSGDGGLVSASARLFTYAKEWRAAYDKPAAAAGLNEAIAFRPDPSVALTVGSLASFLQKSRQELLPLAAGRGLSRRGGTRRGRGVVRARRPDGIQADGGSTGPGAG